MGYRHSVIHVRNIVKTLYAPVDPTALVDFCSRTLLNNRLPFIWFLLFKPLTHSLTHSTKKKKRLRLPHQVSRDSGGRAQISNGKRCRTDSSTILSIHVSSRRKSSFSSFTVTWVELPVGCREYIFVMLMTKGGFTEKERR